MGINAGFYQRIISERRGQVAPLMILFIAGVLVCMMVVFNLGKVSLNKVNTQNAADAGALAASSWLASGANMVADIGQMMNYASLGFIAMMLAVPPWPSLGVALAVIGAFCAQQYAVTVQADTVDDLVHERAGESALIYAFINAGVDEQKREPTAEDDYESWRKEETPFTEFLKDGYTSGEYNWDRWTKFQSWDEANAQFTTFKKERPSSVKVNVGDISHIDYRIGVLPGLTWFCTWPHSGVCGPAPLPYVVIPANITVRGNHSASVEVTREEAGTDWQLWEMEIPTLSSSATARTQGSGSIWSGGNFDCNITSVD